MRKWLVTKDEVRGGVSKFETDLELLSQLWYGVHLSLQVVLLRGEGSEVLRDGGSGALQGAYETLQEAEHRGSDVKRV